MVVPVVIKTFPVLAVVVAAAIARFGLGQRLLIWYYTVFISIKIKINLLSFNVKGEGDKQGSSQKK